MFIEEKIVNNKGYTVFGFNINIIILVLKERILYSRKTLRNDLI